MAQEEVKVEDLTDEQKAAALAAAQHGRVADVDKQADSDDEEHGEPAKKEEEVPSKKEEEETKTEEDDDKSWQEEWIYTGNPDADAAIELMKESGLKPVEGNEIFKDGIAAGDPSKVRWDLLEARLGPAKARLVRSGVEAYYINEYAEQMKVVTHAHEKVGGEENWSKIVKWAEASSKKDKEFAAERADWQKALKVGGFAARAAVDAIVSKYEADPKNSGINNSKLERGNTTPAAKQSGQPLGRAAYFDALEKAGGDRAPQSVKDALWARRQAGMQAGL